MSMLGYLATNVVLMVLWTLLTGATTFAGNVVGFVLGFAALTLIQPEYGRRVGRTIEYVLWLIGQIALSTWQVTVALVMPGRVLTPGIVAVPLRSTHPAEIILLATSVTLTPGTISVETGHDAAGQRVLFVHALLLDDPEALRASIRDDMERRILRFMRPRSAQPPAPPTREEAQP